MQVFTHPACLAHDTGAGHPESPARLAAVNRALESAHPDLDWQQAPRATRGQLLAVHDEAQLAAVLEADPEPRVWLDPDTILSPHSAEAALRAAGAVVAAVDAVMSHRTDRAFCAVRPPGHHATATAAMGFCMFNNIAVGARHALDKHGLERVAIVDFDVHHGNGTQAIFADEPRVLFAGTHQWPLYPGSGAVHERGCGNILNVPLQAGTGSDGFRGAWRERVLPRLEAYRPQLLLVSAGFDGHRRDPLAQLELETEDYAWVSRELVRIARASCDGRIVSTLEGGYDIQTLAESVVAHVDALCF